MRLGKRMVTDHGMNTYVLPIVFFLIWSETRIFKGFIWGLGKREMYPDDFVAHQFAFGRCKNELLITNNDNHVLD